MPQKYTPVVLKSGKDQSVKRFHPWIFSGAIKKIKGPVAEGGRGVVRPGSPGDGEAAAPTVPLRRVVGTAWPMIRGARS